MRGKSRVIAVMGAAIIASAIFFSGCALFKKDGEGGLADALDKEVQTSFDVRYEYRFRSDGKAEPLLNESTVFFDIEQYGLDYLVAGDLVTVTHTGEMYLLETYPSTVRIEKGEVKGVACTRASVMEVECAEKDEGVYVIAEGCIFTSDSKMQYVITDPDGSYEELSEEYVGQKLFASYRPSEEQDGARRLWALYAFDPTLLYKEA